MINLDKHDLKKLQDLLSKDIASKRRGLLGLYEKERTHGNFYDELLEFETCIKLGQKLKTAIDNK